jgi:UDP-glucose 4-epimerase
MTILVTGGTGYIGSHVTVQLLEAGYEVLILDNLSNSKKTVIEKIKKITQKKFSFIEGDIRDKNILQYLFSKNKISAVMHFAGLKSVAESELTPLKYYDNNVIGSIFLFQAMLEANVNKIVFSSSATVYGESNEIQYHENSLLNPVNVYGRTKLIIEEILKNLKKSNNKLSIAILRYFNPVGAHSSGLIGEDPSNLPSNLMPYIAKVAEGELKELNIYGNDYLTLDGTGRRDYIHVEDLASGHIKALDKIIDGNHVLTINLGTGNSYSVLEVIFAFEKASGGKIPYKFTNRRPGDLAEYFANTDLAKKVLGWEAKHGLEKICSDTWNSIIKRNNS